MSRPLNWVCRNLIAKLESPGEIFLDAGCQVRKTRPSRKHQRGELRPTPVGEPLRYKRQSRPAAESRAG